MGEHRTNVPVSQQPSLNVEPSLLSPTFRELGLHNSSNLGLVTPTTKTSFSLPSPTMLLCPLYYFQHLGKRGSNISKTTHCFLPARYAPIGLAPQLSEASRRAIYIYSFPSMISISLSTAVLLPPAFLHASATAFARVLNPSDSPPGRTSLATAAPNSTASMPGATFLFPYIPIPLYSARTAMSYRSSHCARIICGNPMLGQAYQVRTKRERRQLSDLLTGHFHNTNSPHRGGYMR